MKKNGFTVVELIAAFALTMTISIFLFEVLLNVKDIFIETSIKTDLEEKLSIISKNIKYNIKDGSNIECNPNTSCTINGGNLLEVDGNRVTVAGQTYNLSEDIKIKDPALSSVCPPNNNDCYLKINFKLESPNLSNDYEYNMVYYYTKS